ncbi:MAG TPA: hypothetical protein VF042_06480 [Gemmatimonadaceae bacterium]
MLLRSTNFLIVGFTSVMLVACRGDKAPSRADSTASSAQAVTSSVPLPVNTGWEEIQAGPALLLGVEDNPAMASVVKPMLNDSLLAREPALNTDSLSGMSVELFGRTGLIGSAQVASAVAPNAGEGCIAWPMMTLSGAGPKAWQVGFRKGFVTPLPLDSLEGMTPADSMSVTSDLARLASAVPAEGDTSFQGLPFSVRKAYRATSGQQQLLIGDIVRKINEEANPREEHLLLIAERPRSGSQYSTVFHSRATGSEEQVRTTDVLAAGRFVNGGRILLVVSFGYENGNRVALIERMTDSQWRISWRSAYTGC